MISTFEQSPLSQNLCLNGEQQHDPSHHKTLNHHCDSVQHPILHASSNESSEAEIPVLNTENENYVYVIEVLQQLKKLQKEDSVPSEPSSSSSESHRSSDLESNGAFSSAGSMSESDTDYELFDSDSETDLDPGEEEDLFLPQLDEEPDMANVVLEEAQPLAFEIQEELDLDLQADGFPSTVFEIFGYQASIPTLPPTLTSSSPTPRAIDTSSIFRLPVELILAVFEIASAADIRSLRRTCNYLDRLYRENEFSLIGRNVRNRFGGDTCLTVLNLLRTPGPGSKLLDQALRIPHSRITFPHRSRFNFNLPPVSASTFRLSELRMLEWIDSFFIQPFLTRFVETAPFKVPGFINNRLSRAGPAVNYSERARVEKALWNLLAGFKHFHGFHSCFPRAGLPPHNFCLDRYGDFIVDDCAEDRNVRDIQRLDSFGDWYHPTSRVEPVFDAAGFTESFTIPEHIQMCAVSYWLSDSRLGGRGDERGDWSRRVGLGHYESILEMVLLDRLTAIPSLVTYGPYGGANRRLMRHVLLSSLEDAGQDSIRELIALDPWNGYGGMGLDRPSEEALPEGRYGQVWAGRVITVGPRNVDWSGRWVLAVLAGWRAKRFLPGSPFIEWLDGVEEDENGEVQ
ncbi:hypothetical protein BJ508DRAFT_308241 [Ascobolus immersus RN42]|uniref:F-box domain-containing protein n=1 Tax=Ascobolus immersus RN42 TaxID=1160509 RepID=A0A3N4I0J3_ASCIM|nr:hypothetical protein BJ508DRAFT_308241 [Ascobolus immersus RN42]